MCSASKKWETKAKYYQTGFCSRPSAPHFSRNIKFLRWVPSKNAIDFWKLEKLNIKRAPTICRFGNWNIFDEITTEVRGARRNALRADNLFSYKMNKNEYLPNGKKDYTNKFNLFSQTNFLYVHLLRDSLIGVIFHALFCLPNFSILFQVILHVL